VLVVVTVAASLVMVHSTPALRVALATANVTAALAVPLPATVVLNVLVPQPVISFGAALPVRVYSGNTIVI